MSMTSYKSTSLSTRLKHVDDLLHASFSFQEVKACQANLEAIVITYV
jgi:hypothetical protein